MTIEGTGCDGPGREEGTLCGREILAKGLCSSHHQQLLRYGKRDRLRPIRARDGVKLPGTTLWLSPHTAKIVRREAKRLKLPNATIVRQVLDGWAAQQR